MRGFPKMSIKLSNLVKKNFCNSKWNPKIPKHKIIIDPSSYRQPHPQWDIEDANKIEITHVKPATKKDKLAFYIMKVMRLTFDFLTYYKPGKMTEKLYCRRAIFLETVAGVPGMVGGMVRHLRALRGLKEDGGWIHHLLEEAENERMHLLFFMKLRQPGVLMRISIIYTQAVFVFYYSLLYLISPKTAHRFVGYLEEEAVKTYTGMIKELDEGKLPYWKDMPAPPEVSKYYGLKTGASIRDVLVCIRADEIHHREFNHHFADLDVDDKIHGHKITVSEIEELSDKVAQKGAAELSEGTVNYQSPVDKDGRNAHSKL
jgi:hypothetical protein